MCDRLSAQTGGKRSANRYSRASTGHGRDAHMTDTLLAGCSVLVIGDNFFLAEDARDTLERAGATVLGPVSNAEDALSLLDQATPACPLVAVNQIGRASRGERRW